MDSRPTGQPSVPHPCPSVKQPPQVVLQLKVVGLFKGIPFQIARCTAECLKRAHPDKFKDPIMVPLHEFAWHEFLQETKRELKGETWQYPSTVMCFINDQLLGNEGCLQKWAYKKWGQKDFKPMPLYEALTSDYVADYLKHSKRPMVFLEISINEQSIGRLIFELYADLCPKTCQNFQSLCTGNAGFSQSGLKLHYKHTIFHRLVKNGWLQGGDINMGKEMVVSQFMDQYSKMKTLQCHMIKEGFLVWPTRDGTPMGHNSISHYRKLLIWIENM
ncbi:putative inactive peptidyl-prolyl cis-trans isomerase-like 6 isoform X2 [Phascolarctos cinereus]|uniref:Peptidyl-prolyl cis-trans isomerase n=1 Tax=Phascolarctos cinereus TaxID=38626 RepID=A0A6P5M288_PHACI|nr:peptidyl-prolyl cis-trans isomerase-like 6 isoform X1 [Phascolarctos cinereus]